MKILIIRFSSIGDIVLTTPVIRCLKNQLKALELHYLTKKSYEIILRNNPYLDKIYTIEKSTNEIISSLKKEKYDCIIDLHHNLRTFLLKKKLGVKSYAFDKLNFQKYLLTFLKINRLPKVHIVDRYLETTKKLGISNDQKGLDYFIPEKDKLDLKTLPKAFQAGYLAFVIGAKHETKKLPIEKIIQTCKQIAKPIVLLGDKNDFETGEIICNADKKPYVKLEKEKIKKPSPFSYFNRRKTKKFDLRKRIYLEEKKLPFIFNACGKYNLNQSASLIQQANIVLTHDTGLMHIAAAFQKKIVVVWGNTIPEFGMYPYLKNSEKSFKSIEIKDLNCRPCSKIGFETCPKKHFYCMKQIDETDILNAISNLKSV